MGSVAGKLVPTQVERVVAPLSASTSRRTLHTVFRLPFVTSGELTAFASWTGQSSSAPKARPGENAEAPTGFSRPAWPSLSRSRLLSRSLAMKSETGATLPGRTTYCWVLVPAVAARTMPTLFASVSRVPGTLAGSPGFPSRAGKGDPVALVQRRQPGGGDPLGLGVLVDQGAQEQFVVGYGVRLARGVHEIAGPVGPFDVHHLAAAQPRLVVRFLLLALGEDEGRFLDGPPTLTGPFADGPSLGGSGVLGVGQPVGGVGDAERRAVRDRAVVQDRFVDVDDLALVLGEQELGRGHVQDGVELLLAAGLQHHVTGGGLAGDDDVLVGVVPALGGHRLEHAPGAEDGEDDADDRSRYDRAQGARCAFLGAGRVGLQELCDQPPLRKGVGVEFIPP
ncbi:hypothetical protein SMICM17S_01324 [Streptomyces microflavus]